jgi:predicted oxidoreductase
MTVPRIALNGSSATVSQLAAGCWRLVEQSGGDSCRVEAFIARCLALGITTFDHADVYGRFNSEPLFGDVLRRQPALRRQMELVTKCGIAPVSAARPLHRVLHLNSTASYIIDAAENSLRTLGTDYLNVLLIHRPDLLMNCDEVAAAFVKLREQGKVLAFGVSNFSSSSFDLLQSKLPFRLVTNQIELSILQTQALRDGTLDHLMSRAVPVMAWSPLAGGRLFSANDPDSSNTRNTLSAVAKRHDAEPLTIAIAWILRLPARMLPVLGTIDGARLELAVRAFNLSLDRQDWYEIYASAGNSFA